MDKHHRRCAYVFVGQSSGVVPGRLQSACGALRTVVVSMEGGDVSGGEPAEARPVSENNGPPSAGSPPVTELGVQTVNRSKAQG